MAFSPDGKTMLIGSMIRRLACWMCRQAKNSAACLKPNCTAAQFFRRMATLSFSALLTGLVRVWDIRPRPELPSSKVIRRRQWGGLFARRQILGDRRPGWLAAVERADRAALACFLRHQLNRLGSEMFSPDGKYLLSGNSWGSPACGMWRRALKSSGSFTHPLYRSTAWISRRMANPSLLAVPTMAEYYLFTT